MHTCMNTENYYYIYHVLAAASPNAAVLDTTRSAKITPSKAEMSKPLFMIRKSSNQPEISV